MARLAGASEAIGATEFAERIGNAVRFEGVAKLAKFIRCGIGEKRISAKNTKELVLVAKLRGDAWRNDRQDDDCQEWDEF